MGVPAMLHTTLKGMGTLVLLALLARSTSGPAQIIFPGATVQGDILRGEGIFLQGAGLYNYYSAGANAINTDTWMRLNEYLYQSARLGYQRAAQRRADEFQRKKEHHKKILDRIANNPEQ